MTEPDLHHDLQADPSDDLVWKLRTVFEALDDLQQAALDIQCPGCDPDGEKTEQARLDLLDNYGVDPSDAHMLLGRAADVRHTLLAILIPPTCTCDHSEDDDAHGADGSD